jgi:hypothetical protein
MINLGTMDDLVSDSIKDALDKKELNFNSLQT